MPGQCEGVLLHAEKVETHQICQDRCDQRPGCEYYTFSYDDFSCYHFEDCPSLSEDFCDRFVQGGTSA